MSAYRVAFMKKLCGSNGRQYDCLQDQFDLISATPEEAQAAAIERFRKMRGMQDWRIFADRIDVKSTEAATEAAA